MSRGENSPEDGRGLKAIPRKGGDGPLIPGPDAGGEVGGGLPVIAVRKEPIGLIPPEELLDAD